MRTVSEETRITMNTRRDFVNYAHVTLHDGTELNLTPSDFRISGNSFTDDWNEGESFQLGSAIGKTATLLLDNTDGRTEEIGNGISKVYPHGKFSEYDFYMAYFELYVHLPNSTHYQGELIDEVISIGTFTVTTPASHGATIEITGVDNMHMFDRPFDDCTLNFATNPSLLTILNRCCSDCGVAIGYTDFLNSDIPVNKKPEGVTYREVVSFIAQIAGCNAVISVTGALTLKYYDMSPINEILDGGRFLPWDGVDNVRDTLDGGSFEPWTEGDIVDGGNFTDSLKYHNLTATNGTTVSTDDIHFTGVMVSYEVTNSEGNTETQAVHYPDVPDWDTYAMQIADNPFIYDGVVRRNGTDYNIPDVVAKSVWDVISPLDFRVFSCQSIQDPTIEAGDCALVYDVKGNIYPTIITNVRFVTGGMTEVSCTAESPVKQNSRYVNPAAKAVAKAEKRQDDYNAMVAHFNELANSALGYFKTQVVEQGATVTYIHDNPDLAASTIIWKITATGYFVSEDGGQSWNTGYDASTGTMLMNLIYVKGLNANWIVAGTIDTNRLNVSGIITAINNNGTTYINGGKIATGTMNANRIGAGTIDASVISVTNLNASNITSGTMSASRITSGTMSAARISGGTLTLGGNNNGNGVCVVQNASGTTKVRLNNSGITASAGTIAGWTIDSDGFTDGSDAWVKPKEIACGKHGATLVKMIGKSTEGDNSGYLSVEVNASSDYVRVYTDEIRKKSSSGTVSVQWISSDRRLKKNIENLTLQESLDLVYSALPRKFEMKDEPGTRYGFIAQELREVLDDDCAIEFSNSKDEDDFRAVHYDDFIAPLCMIVKNQQAEIDDLKARLERLESIVNNHE